jgi:hypothetical protein
MMTATAPRGLRVMSSAPAAFRTMAPVPKPVRLGTPGTRPHSVRPYRRPTYKPAMIASAPRKQLGAMADVPMSLGLGAVGIGSMLLSGIVPQPIKTILQVTGVGLIAFGAITLVTPPAAAKTTEETTGPEPIGEEGTFNAITASIVEPSYNAAIPLGFLSSDYDVKVQWFNPTDQAITVDFQVYAEETPVWTGLFSESVGQSYRSVAHSGRVYLPAHKKETVEMQIPLKNPEGAGDASQINMSISKVRKGQPVEVASKSFQVYTNAFERWMNPASYF